MKQDFFLRSHFLYFVYNGKQQLSEVFWDNICAHLIAHNTYLIIRAKKSLQLPLFGATFKVISDKLLKILQKKKSRWLIGTSERPINEIGGSTWRSEAVICKELVGTTALYGDVKQAINQMVYQIQYGNSPIYLVINTFSWKIKLKPFLLNLITKYLM